MVITIENDDKVSPEEYLYLQSVILSRGGQVVQDVTILTTHIIQAVMKNQMEINVVDDENGKGRAIYEMYQHYAHTQSCNITDSSLNKVMYKPIKWIYDTMASTNNKSSALSHIANPLYVTSTMSYSIPHSVTSNKPSKSTEQSMSRLLDLFRIKPST
jgi:hypothetical protein